MVWTHKDTVAAALDQGWLLRRPDPSGGHGLPHLLNDFAAQRDVGPTEDVSHIPGHLQVVFAIHTGDLQGWDKCVTLPEQAPCLWAASECTHPQYLPTPSGPGSKALVLQTLAPTLMLWVPAPPGPGQTPCCCFQPSVVHEESSTLKCRPLG